MAVAVTLLSVASASASTVLQATAYVNLAGNPPRAVSFDGTPVQQSASNAHSSAMAQASETSVGARAHSQDGVLSETAFGSASESTTFTVTSSAAGASGIPLTFNLAVDGSISATSDPAPSSGPNISVANVSVRSNVDLVEGNGGLILGSQHGYLVLYLPSGILGAGGASEGQVKLVSEVRLADPLNALPFDLLPILNTFTVLGRTLGEVTAGLDVLIEGIRQTAKNVGFPELGIGPGKSVPIWTAKYIVETSTPMTVTVVPNDGHRHNLALSITTQASSAPIGTSDASYSNTVAVRSITVPADYRGDPNDIVIKFESGTALHASRPVARRRAVRH
jgi:hypothetical protein